MFLDKSLKGTAALALSGLFVFSPRRGNAASGFPSSVDLPSPQFPAWTADESLLASFIAPDGNYGLLRRNKGTNRAERMLSIGTGAGQFNYPQGISVHDSIVYIVDSNNGRIQRLDLRAGNFLEPFGGLGRKTGLFLRPRGICVFQDELFIADTRNHRVQVFSMEGAVKRAFGELGDGDSQFRLPVSCAVSMQGEVFVVDSKHCFVKAFDLDGRFIRKFGGLSSSRKEPGRLNRPAGISLDKKSGVVYIADSGNSRLAVFESSGRFLRTIEPPAPALKNPLGLALSDSGTLAVADPDANKIWMTAV